MRATAWIAATLGVLAAAACAPDGTGPGEPSVDSSFSHEISESALPWNHEDFDAAQDKFTFAVFSDLTGGERPGIFEVAVAQLNLLRPELIINVGDLIEGDSDEPGELGRQWDSFDERADRARAPVFYVGGNHDLSSQALRAVWADRTGPHYYHFVYRNVLFLVLDTEDNPPERMAEIHRARTAASEVLRNEGAEAFWQTEYYLMPERAAGTIGAEQSAYFHAAIADHPEVRWTFLFMHKPAWEREGDENFAAIEAALTDRPYTVFHGHTHTYRYLERHGRDYINLATTGGVQLPDFGRSMDHVTMVTVDDADVSIANVLLAGVLDKSGHIPAGGDDLVFETQPAR